MQKVALSIGFATILAGCATPAVTLKNEMTGQVARCGGDSTGFMTGGLIGHNLQLSSDDKCVRDFESQGFKRVQ
jgi:hypothetical protein